MQLSLSIGLDELHQLPPELREKIRQALGDAPPAPKAAVPPIITAAPAQVVTTTTVAVAPPVVTKAPVIQGNTKVFKPDMGHPTQTNSAVDVMTGRPVAVSAPSEPAIPQFSNTPVNVAPVTTAGPVQMNLNQQPNADFVRQAAVRLWNNKELGGKSALDAAVARAGMPNMLALTEQNAPALYSAILAIGGK